MDRRSRSISPRRYGGGRNGGGNNYRRYSRSRSRSRDRGVIYRNNVRRSRSHSRDHSNYRGADERDLYRDIVNQDYQDQDLKHARGGVHRSRDEYYDERDRYYEKPRDKIREYDDRERDRRDKRYGKRYSSVERDSDDSDDIVRSQYCNKNPASTIIVFGLQSHITETDIMSSLIQTGLAPVSIRLIRKRATGASRGFAFVEFNTVEEAVQWMEITQGTIVLQETCRATMEYSHTVQKATIKINNATDWYCGKCGVFNFKRRDSCFKCKASREESERGGEGSDEISNILTKKIMIRGLDVLTNEEGVLTAITQYAPDLAKKVTKVLISRDALTQTSRGICYLNFETLVDSMNMHNLLSTLEPPLQIDSKEVVITYCIDHENRQIVPKNDSSLSGVPSASALVGPMTAAELAATTAAGSDAVASGQYTLADVPRLARYSASLYATSPAEHASYMKYYTDYYITEIANGSCTNLPTDKQSTEANSGAAVALSAIMRKQKKMSSIETTATAAALAAAAAAKAALASHHSVITPKGNDGKVYPTPDVTLYQYDETSGYYYDPTTGLYYDAHSQYYYNNETGAYLYWDQRKSTYILATPASTAASIEETVKESAIEAAAAETKKEKDEEEKKEKKEPKQHDKVKVAKKIVKDMEKWAKQLNQKKDYTVVATPQPILPSKGDEMDRPSSSSSSMFSGASGYADVGFSILEKKTTNKLGPNYMATAAAGGLMSNKLISSYGSDSDDDNGPMTSSSKSNPTAELTEMDYVDFQKLTCLLCKRAFQSLEILQKHLKMSNLHKENLTKHNLDKGMTTQQQQRQQQHEEDSLAAALSYRDRAKERRQKYGESDPPPPNRSRERFEKEIKNLTSKKSGNDSVSLPIGSNNVGNRLLQKMGWSEGQGLGRKNQGRTNIIEADARNSHAGLGTKAGMAPGDDYKSYIKKMMKSRYESA